MLNLAKVKNIYCIGIGGIGLSALARMFFLEGKQVTGSDRETSKVTESLGKLGISVSIGDVCLPNDCDLVVYTNALPSDHPELTEARRRGIPTLSYPEALGLALHGKFVIAISGTHGKTTTTAMVGKVLIDARLKPTVIVGSFIKDPKTGEETNFIAGESRYVVVEADEYKEAFLNLTPNILVITNIDEDHLDHYRDLAHIQETFGKLTTRIPNNGILITDTNNSNLQSIVKSANCAVVDYTNVEADWRLKVPGRHNQMNARAAATVAAVLDVPADVIKNSLENFGGVWRRFEYKGKTAKGALVYEDYAHNPEKVAAALAGARELFPDRRIYAVFQPHLYSRTKTLFKKFARVFGAADVVILAPIYAAREQYDHTISSEMLASALADGGRSARALGSFEEIAKFLNTDLKAGDICILIGAGDIGKVCDLILGN